MKVRFRRFEIKITIDHIMETEICPNNANILAAGSFGKIGLYDRRELKIIRKIDCNINGWVQGMKWIGTGDEIGIGSSSDSIKYSISISCFILI